MLTEVGPVEIDVPRDRDGTFEPKIVRKRQRRLSGVDELVISLSAKGLTTGEMQAHLAEVYGAEVSRQTISTITDKVIEGMAEWQNRPLDPVYPVIFIDAINVKIRDGKVANRPIYVALAVTCEGRRDILGLWAGEAPSVTGGRSGGRQVLAARAHRDQEPRRGRRAHGRLRRPDRAARRDLRPCGRRRSPRPAWCTCCATASATPAASTTTRSPRRCARSTPRRPRPRRRSGSWSSAETWGERYPAIVRLWENAWAEFVPFLSFDVEIRKIICTTNAIESVNARIRRAVKARGHFPNEQAALKCVYMADHEPRPDRHRPQRRWTMRWKPALNAFDITFDGRLSAGRK